jgi:predicted RNase H-like nuclease
MKAVMPAEAGIHLENKDASWIPAGVYPAEAGGGMTN